MSDTKLNDQDAASESRMLLSYVKVFRKQFLRNYAKAKESGAVPDDIHPMELAKVILLLTAEQFVPLSRNARLLAINLRHFI